MKRSWRAKLLAVMTVLSFIYTISQSQIERTQYFLANYPWTIMNLRDIYIICVNQTWVKITVVLLLCLIDEKIWGRTTSSSP